MHTIPITDMNLIPRNAFFPEWTAPLEENAARSKKTGKHAGKAAEPAAPASPAAPAESPIRASKLSDIAIVIASRMSPERGAALVDALVDEAQAEGGEAVFALMRRALRLVKLGLPVRSAERFARLGRFFSSKEKLLARPEASRFFIDVLHLPLQKGSKARLDLLEHKMLMRERLADWPAESDADLLGVLGEVDSLLRQIRECGGEAAALDRLKRELAACTGPAIRPALPNRRSAFAVHLLRVSEMLIDERLERGGIDEPASARAAAAIAERGAALRSRPSALAHARAAECCWLAGSPRKAAAHAAVAVAIALEPHESAQSGNPRPAPACDDDHAVRKLDESPEERREGLERALGLLFEAFDSPRELPAAARSLMNAEAAKPYPKTSGETEEIFWLLSTWKSSTAGASASRELAEELARGLHPQPAREILGWGEERQRAMPPLVGFCAAAALSNYASELARAARPAADEPLLGAEVENLFESPRRYAALEALEREIEAVDQAIDALTREGTHVQEAFGREAAFLILAAGRISNRAIFKQNASVRDEDFLAPPSNDDESEAARLARLEESADAVAERSLDALEALPKRSTCRMLRILTTHLAFQNVCEGARTRFALWACRQEAAKDLNYSELRGPVGMLSALGAIAGSPLGSFGSIASVVSDPLSLLAAGRRIKGEAGRTLREASLKSWRQLERLLRAAAPDFGTTKNWLLWLKAAAAIFPGLAASARGGRLEAEAAEKILAVLRALEASAGDDQSWLAAHAAVMTGLRRWGDAAASLWDEAANLDASETFDALFGGGLEGAVQPMTRGSAVWEAWRRERWTAAWKDVLAENASSWLSPLGSVESVLSREDSHALVARIKPAPALGLPTGVELLATLGASSIARQQSAHADESEKHAVEAVLPIEAAAALPWWAAASAAPLAVHPAAVVDGPALWTASRDEEEAQRAALRLRSASLLPNNAFLSAAAALGTAALPTAASRAFDSPQAEGAWLAESAGLAAMAAENGLARPESPYACARWEEIQSGAGDSSAAASGYAGLLFAKPSALCGKGFPETVEEGFDGRGPFKMDIAQTPFASVLFNGDLGDLPEPQARPKPKASRRRAVPLRVALPIYAEELCFIDALGLEAFLARAARAGASLLPARLGRPNLCEGFSKKVFRLTADIVETVPDPLGSLDCIVTAGVLLTGRIALGLHVPKALPPGVRSGWIFLSEADLAGPVGEAMRRDVPELFGKCHVILLNAAVTLAPGLKDVVGIEENALAAADGKGGFKVKKLPKGLKDFLGQFTGASVSMENVSGG